MFRGRTRPSWHAGAEVLLVTVGAELRVVRGDVLVPLHEVGRVLRVVQPARRLHLAAREHGLDAAAFLRAALHVARLAGRLRVAARRGVGMLMTAEAAAHAGHLVARGELDLLHVAVALLAVDVPRRVLLVVEHHVRPRDVELRDQVAVALLVTEVAEVALAARLVAGRDAVQVIVRVP